MLGNRPKAPRKTGVRVRPLERTPAPPRPLRRRRRRRSTALRWLPVAAATIAGFGFLILTDGGRAVRHADPLIVQFDRFAEQLGLGLSHVALSGYKMTPDDRIFAALDLEPTRSLLTFDSVAARRRIEQLPWVDEARIRRTFPHRVDVEIRERQPIARWHGGKTEILIDRAGRHLAAVRAGAVRSLPLVSGAGAEPLAHTIIAAVARWPDLVAAVARAERVQGRRWTLHLADKRRILLPEDGIAAALQDLMRGKRGHRLFDRRFNTADFRIPGNLVMRGLSASSGRSLSKRRRPRRRRSSVRG